MASPSRLPSVRRAAGSNTNRPVSMIDGPVLNPDASGTNNPGPAPTSKISKRRSLLPQFSSRGKASPPEEKEKEKEREELKGVAEDDERSETSSGLAGGKGRSAMEDSERKSMRPPSSRLTRPMSMYVSGSGGSGLTRTSTNATAHARAPSNARVDSLAKLTGSGRPTSRAGRPDSAKAPAAGHSRTTSAKSRDSGNDDRQNRASSSSISTVTSEKRVAGNHHGRQLSAALSQTSDAGGSPPSPAHSASSRQRSTSNSARTQMPPASRPTFNTFQQHYSPAKGSSALPKPPLPSAARPSARSLSTPAPIEEDPANAPDTSKLQIELLQLSLLHQDALRTSREYAASAKRKMGRKHAKLAKDYSTIHASEKDHQRFLNLSALEAWCPDHALLVENLQILSNIYVDLVALLQPQSRYSDLVATFTAWIDDTDAVASGARQGFAESLPESWRTTHTSLALKLRALQRELDSLPHASRGKGVSSLASLLGSCQTLLEGMLKEVEVMVKLEREVSQRERVRVEDEVEALALGLGEGKGKEAWTPAWGRVEV